MTEDKAGEQEGEDVLQSESGDVSKDLEQDVNFEVADSDRVIYLSNVTVSHVTVILCEGCRHEAPIIEAHND